MIRGMILCTTVLLTPCLTAWAADPPAAQPVTAPAVDYLKDLIDNYVQGEERTRFFAAAGVDGELTAEEWQAAAGKADSFVRKYDSWNYAITFDKSADKQLAWAEAEAYRLAVAKRVLAACDEDKDGKLTGAERERANQMLAGGLRAPGSARAWSRGGEGFGSTQYWDRNRDGKLDETETAAMEAQRAEWAQRVEEARKQREEMVARYDADKDGQISGEERRAMWEGFRAEQQKRELEQWDANKDGKIDDEERAAQRESFRKRAEEAAQAWLVRRHDKDGDGKLNAEEQAALDAEKARAEQMRAEWENRRREFTKRWDADGNGELSETEQTKMREEIRSQMEATRKKMDADGDGNVSREEARGYWDSLRKKYDADGDGQLNDEERRKMTETESGGMIPGGMFRMDRGDRGRGGRGRGDRGGDGRGND